MFKTIKIAIAYCWHTEMSNSLKYIFNYMSELMCMCPYTANSFAVYYSGKASISVQTT